MSPPQRWPLLLIAAGVLAMAVTIGVDDLRGGLVAGALGLLAVGALALWWGRRGRHTPWPRAEALRAEGQAVVLWKPGCMYCEMLLLQLRDDPRVTWVNVWRDEAANAQVRAVNGGDELTPTVLIGDEVLRNPSAATLREHLAAAGTAGGNGGADD
ncbi:glutaredoxin family protein [Brachybacterium saurashtrense]|uniref:Glutaredoxin domain-containing protein n=1 Tax=Brachybacterium saurashtrense TaxID=556288 RepID=A0A345YQU6_9MICO|nr:hypothetical protein [Brachybacterium saurashtrense]AXK46298.1 hypothetical protein DWV08_12215 [Brachybacterium saurashtrense]RRR24038.1 hypothetical protein DXU92_03965 [Brachybacterium saurashtrense]